MTDAEPRMERLRREVIRRYGVGPDRVRVARSPYRICPLGAHVDHQRGPVTAMAVDRNVLIAFAPSGSREVRLGSLDFPGEVVFSLDAVPGRRGDDWGNYPQGAALALQRRHPLGEGIVGVVSGELHGGGVSSSAAVGVAYLLALEEANGLSVPPEENIVLDQEIENGYLGLRNGILDQAAILLSRRGHLLKVDCATAGHELIPAPPGLPPFTILLAFSGVRQSLVGTEYNRRVSECAEAARVLLSAAGRGDEEAVLGNVTAEEYAAHQPLLDGAPARRAAHFFSEVDRVRRGVLAWEAGDLAGFGALMTASGESSIGNYECGSPPLIDLYHALVAAEGVHGARFSGAGFRGCCVALVRPDLAAAAATRVREDYVRRHPEFTEHAAFVLCGTDDGAAILGSAS